MSWKIEIERKALKFIMKQPEDQKRRLLAAIYKLPDRGDRKRLQGKLGKGKMRLRVGEYRVIYSVDDGRLIVYVIEAGNRGQIYNKYR